jgi:hypothetical protein
MTRCQLQKVAFGLAPGVIVLALAPAVAAETVKIEGYIVGLCAMDQILSNRQLPKLLRPRRHIRRVQQGVDCLDHHASLVTGELQHALCRRAVVSLDGPIARARIMGVVENMGVLPHRESATMDLRGTAPLPDSSLCVHSEIERLRTRSTNVGGSVPQRGLVRQYERSKISAKSGDSAAHR